MSKECTCPTCGWKWRKPLGIYIPSTPWGDCACSDNARCLAHQYNPEGAPKRPPPEVLHAKAKEIHEAALRRWEEKKAALKLPEGTE